MNVVIKNDGKPLPNICGRNLIKQFGPQRIKFNGDVRLVKLRIDPDLSVSQQVAGDHRFFLDDERNFRDGAGCTINGLFF